jgi:hypothetical protein
MNAKLKTPFGSENDLTDLEGIEVDLSAAICPLPTDDAPAASESDSEHSDSEHSDSEHSGSNSESPSSSPSQSGSPGDSGFSEDEVSSSAVPSEPAPLSPFSPFPTLVPPDAANPHYSRRSTEAHPGDHNAPAGQFRFENGAEGTPLQQQNSTHCSPASRLAPNPDTPYVVPPLSLPHREHSQADGDLGPHSAAGSVRSNLSSAGDFDAELAHILFPAGRIVVHACQAPTTGPYCPLGGPVSDSPRDEAALPSPTVSEVLRDHATADATVACLGHGPYSTVAQIPVFADFDQSDMFLFMPPELRERIDAHQHASVSGSDQVAGASFIAVASAEAHLDFVASSAVEVAAGASEEVKARLFVAQYEEDPEMDRPLCFGCLCQVEPRQEFVALPCRHPMHWECALDWLSANSRCPQCGVALE